MDAPGARTLENPGPQPQNKVRYTKVEQRTVLTKGKGTRGGQKEPASITFICDELLYGGTSGQQEVGFPNIPEKRGAAQRNKRENEQARTAKRI